MSSGLLSSPDPKVPDEPIRLVGHSHGGNVDKLVTQKLVEQGYSHIVDDVMFIDTPVISDYVLNNNALTNDASVINTYIIGDIIQTHGGNMYYLPFIGEIGTAGQTINNNSRVQNIEIFGQQSTTSTNVYTNAILLTSPTLLFIYKKYQDFMYGLSVHENADSVNTINQLEQKKR